MAFRVRLRVRLRVRGGPWTVELMAFSIKRLQARVRVRVRLPSL